MTTKAIRDNHIATLCWRFHYAVAEGRAVDAEHLVSQLSAMTNPALVNADIKRELVETYHATGELRHSPAPDRSMAMISGKNRPRVIVEVPDKTT